MRFVLKLLTASAALISYVADAVADSPSLMGSYGFTRNVTCIESAAGFDSNFVAVGPTVRQSFAEEGVRTFNGDGTGTQSSKNLNIFKNENTGSVGAASSHFTDNFKYIINGDGTWTIPGGGTISGTVETGPRASQTFTITNIAPSVGHILRNAMTLTLATVTPQVEIITYYSGGVFVDSFSRICNRTNVLISLPPAP